MRRRIIYSDDGTLSDYSVELNNYHSGLMQFSLVAAEDNIYIGSDLPFNHVYIKLNGTDVNAEASVLSVSYWDDDQFRAVVESIDETSSGGATLAQSGFVTWVPNKDYLWTKEDTNFSGEEVTGLTDVVIYKKYWVKLAFSANLTADVKISWIGQKFANDEDLYSEFPEFANSSFLAAFESGKTDWEEQHIRAAKVMTDQLIRKNIIKSGDQLLKREVLMPAAVQKVAELIYASQGDDYVDQKLEARKEYNARLANINFKVDRDSDAILDDGEKFVKQGYLYR